MTSTLGGTQSVERTPDPEEAGPEEDERDEPQVSPEPWSAPDRTSTPEPYVGVLPHDFESSDLGGYLDRLRGSHENAWYASGLGRRKSAIARVHLRPGSGQWWVNGKSLLDYFGRPGLAVEAAYPLVSMGQHRDVDILVNVSGGGFSGQAGAMSLAVARALDEFSNQAYHAELRRLGLLTRDARVVERKKAGRKKARKKSQFSKR